MGPHKIEVGPLLAGGTADPAAINTVVSFLLPPRPPRRSRPHCWGQHRRRELLALGRGTGPRAGEAVPISGRVLRLGEAAQLHVCQGEEEPAALSPLRSACHVAGSSPAALAGCPSQLGISAPVPSCPVAEQAVVIQALGQAWVVSPALLAGPFLPCDGLAVIPAKGRAFPHLPISMVGGRRTLQSLPRPWRGGTSLQALLFLCRRALFSCS